MCHIKTIVEVGIIYRSFWKINQYFSQSLMTFREKIAKHELKIRSSSVVIRN